MRHFRLILTFYQSFFFVSTIITMACLYITYIHGLKALSSLLLLKIMSLGLIFLYLSKYKRRDFFYYQNLGISRLKLWVYSMTLDVLVFILLIILTLFAR